MPRINIQVVGLIELDTPEGGLEACAEGATGLWQDLVQIGAEPAFHQTDVHADVSSNSAAPRWGRAESSSANLTTTPPLYADLPRLCRELDAELGTLVERLWAAREE